MTDNRYSMKNTGQRIRQIRKTNGLTQERLADRLNVSTEHIGRIETGKKGASIDLLVEFAMEFSISLDYLIIGKQKTTEEIKELLISVIDQLSELEKKI